MRKKIYISEESVRKLSESGRELTFFSFFTDMKNFIADLLRDPCKASPSETLTRLFGEKEHLIQKLIDKNVITRKEKVEEPYNADKKRKEAVYHVSYKVPRNGFKDKIRMIYMSVKPENISEATAAGGAGMDSTGQFVTRINKDLMRRKIYAPFFNEKDEDNDDD